MTAGSGLDAAHSLCNHAGCRDPLARRLCVLIGSPRALAIAVKNSAVDRRYTALDERLRPAPPRPAPRPIVSCPGNGRKIGLW
jgi:hypothetical protein